MAKKLTQLMVDKLQPPKARTMIADSVLEGFHLRYWQSKKDPQRVDGSYSIRFRSPVTHRQPRFTIGSIRQIKLSTARARARGLFEEISAGIDPVLEKSRRRQAHTNGSTPGTLGALIPEFYKRYLQQRRKGAGDALRTLERELLEAKPSWRDWPISTPTKVDIHAKLDRLMDAGKIYAANRLLEVIRVMFKYAKQRGYIDTNPAEDIDKPGNEKARQRVLDDNELCAVWGAFGELGYPFGPLFKLLLLTGQRKGEVAAMTWNEIDLDAALWSIPAERTKSDRAHKIPLSGWAVDILRSIPRMTSTGHVFTGRESTGHAVSGFTRAMDRARLASGIDDWRLHDLRRTVRTRLGEIGTPPHVAELVLNHTVKGLQAVYDRYEYTREKREALDKWAAHLKGIVEGKKTNVIELDKPTNALTR